MKNSESHLLDQIIQLTSVEKFQGSTTGSIAYFKQKHEDIRKKFPSLKIVTIGGTNGKGHVAYALESILSQQQISVAKWSSPHLYTICERFTLNGLPISLEQLTKHVNNLKETCAKLKLSFYEFMFACFCDYILSLDELNNLDILILEVGLGGRLDTTNLFDADISVLTSIGLDHTEILGNTLKAILLEKIEISRSGRKHISGLKSEYLKKIEQNFVSQRGGDYIGVGDKDLNYFSQNNRVTQAILKELNINKSAQNWSEVYYGPGRMQKFALGSSELILNSSHNFDGFKALCEYLYEDNIKFDHILLGFSDRRQIEIERIIKLIKTYPCRFEKIHMSCFEHPRALMRSEAVKIAANNSIPFVNYEEFFDTIKDEKNTKKALVTGSNYFLSEVYRQLII